MRFATQVIYADEIGHCAAGVRWLKYLHKLAHDPGAEGPGGEREGGVGNNQTDEAKNGAMTEGQEGTKEAVVEGEGGEVAQKADSGEQGAAKESHVPAWVADARKFASVEKWFHHLVKGHFFGALKPPFNTEARERAGFTPEWYEPLCDKDYVPEPDVV